MALKEDVTSCYINDEKPPAASESEVSADEGDAFSGGGEAEEKVV